MDRKAEKHEIDAREVRSSFEELSPADRVRTSDKTVGGLVENTGHTKAPFPLGSSREVRAMDTCGASGWMTQKLAQLGRYNSRTKRLGVSSHVGVPLPPRQDP
jgi:hypothetical protein